MLAADLRVIDQKNIASMDVVETVDLHTVLYRHAEIGEKNRQGAFILRYRPTLVIDDADAVVLHLVDHHVIGGFLEHSRHFVSGCFQTAANDFYGDRINGHDLARPLKKTHLLRCTRPTRSNVLQRVRLRSSIVARLASEILLSGL